MDLLVGRSLGPYDLTERVGGGGMGTVYRANHRLLLQPRAVKVLPWSLSADAGFVQRFRREAMTAAGLRHPNVVQIYDVGEQDGVHYIVMELLEGRSLHQLIRSEGPVVIDRAVHLLRQLADALDYAHTRGVAHRDVKPANVLVARDDHVTLVDFGIARAPAETRLTGTGKIVGTLEYMAPEVVTGSGGGPGADLYALGVVAYEMLAGRAPFRGDTPALMYAHLHEPPPPPRLFRADLSEAVERCLLRMLAKDPAERFSSAGSFVAALGSAGPLAPPDAAESDPTAPTVSPEATWRTRVDWAPDGGGDDHPHLGGHWPSAGGIPRASATESPTPAMADPRPRVVAATLTPPPLTAPPVPEAAGARTDAEREARDWSATSTDPASAKVGRRPAQALRWPMAALLVVAVGVFATSRWGLVQPEQAAAPTAVPAQVAGPPAAAPTSAPPATPVPAPATSPPTQTAPTLAPTAEPRPPTPSPEQGVQAARAALEGDEFPRALAMLDELDRDAPGSPGLRDVRYQAHLGYGKYLLARNQFDDSYAQYDRALKVRPNDSAALAGQQQVVLTRDWNKMEASWGQDDEAAIGALEGIMQLDANFRETRQKLYALLISKADRLLGTGERGAAFPVLTRALEVHPEGSEARQRLASYTPTPAPPPPVLLQPTQPQPRPQPAQSQPAPARPAPAPAPQPQPVPAGPLPTKVLPGPSR